MTGDARTTEGASRRTRSAAGDAAIASPRIRRTARVATGSAEEVERAPFEEEKAPRGLLGRAACTGSEAGPPVAGDRRRRKAAREARRASRNTPSAARGLAGASRRTRSASRRTRRSSRRTTRASQRTRRAAQRTRSAWGASIDPALLVALAHLSASSGTHSRPSAPLRVTRASAPTPPSPLALEQEALASASASRGTQSASRSTSTAALVLRRAALTRPISAQDGARARFWRWDEAFTASKGGLLDEREASCAPKCALEVPREALLRTRAALPAPWEARFKPRAAVERRTFSPTAGSVPRCAMDCAVSLPVRYLCQRRRRLGEDLNGYSAGAGFLRKIPIRS